MLTLPKKQRADAFYSREGRYGRGPIFHPRKGKWREFPALRNLQWVRRLRQPDDTLLLEVETVALFLQTDKGRL